MDRPLVALIDIGKTHSRVGFFDPVSCEEVWTAQRSNNRLETRLGLQLDVLAIERWLVTQLRVAPHKERVSAILPIAHGAAAALVTRDGEVVGVPDYEDSRFEQVNEAYGRERDPFEVTFSPSLPHGLNLGRQLFHLERAEPHRFGRVAHLLLYPQYWAWRLTGRMASEVTSLGCHSDLWHPQEGAFSDLARSHDWARLFPQIRYAGDVLGLLSSEMACATGLDPGCAVVCGIHDSNASYLQHLIDRPKNQAFAVISSGTWTVVLASGVDLKRLRADRDMLANVDAFGTPAATARFMGGREYEVIARTHAPPDFDSLVSVIQRGAFALPSFAPGGPFAGRNPELLRTDGLNDAERAALATTYTALMTDLLLEELGVVGEVVVDGPLARNPLFAPLIATFRTVNPISLSDGTSGRARTGSYLTGFKRADRTPLRTAIALDAGMRGPLDAGRLRNYRIAWRELLNRGASQ